MCNQPISSIFIILQICKRDPNSRISAFIDRLTNTPTTTTPTPPKQELNPTQLTSSATPSPTQRVKLNPEGAKSNVVPATIDATTPKAASKVRNDKDKDKEGKSLA